MELMVAGVIGVMTAAGIYLVLRQRTFPAILGIALLSYAVNVFLFTSGRLVLNAPPVLTGDTGATGTYTDPLPQALVLTAIVISFGMTAVVVLMSLGSYLTSGTDRSDMAEVGEGEARP